MAPGYGIDATSAGGQTGGAVGTLHEVRDDDDGADGVMASRTAGAGCPPLNWTGPAVVRWAEQVWHVHAVWKD